MVGVLASGGVKSWVRAQSGQTKDHEIGICCFSTKHSALGVKSKNGWLEVRIMCSSGVICIPADCCFSELALLSVLV